VKKWLTFAFVFLSYLQWNLNFTDFVAFPFGHALGWVLNDKRKTIIQNLRFCFHMMFKHQDSLSIAAM